MTTTTTDPAQAALAQIAAAVGQPFTRDLEHLVAVVLQRVALADEAHAAGAARAAMDQERKIGRGWLRLARKTLAGVAACERCCPDCGSAAAAVAERIDAALGRMPEPPELDEWGDAWIPPEIPPAELADLHRLLATYQELGGGFFYHGIPLTHMLPLLRTLQRAATELFLEPDEFEAVAQEGRALQNHLCGPLPTLRPHLNARWGRHLAAVYPPQRYREGPELEP